MSDFEKDIFDCSGECGSCGLDCEGEGPTTVTLTLDDGTVQECAILTIYPASGKDYIALLPLDENGESMGNEVYLYRFTEENGQPSLENIEDDEEYEIAADAFDEYMDNMEFDEMIGEENAEE